MPNELFAQIFEMGGYAPYIWSAYAITFVIIFWMVGSSLWKRQKMKQEEEKLSKSS